MSQQETEGKLLKIFEGLGDPESTGRAMTVNWAEDQRHQASERIRRLEADIEWAQAHGHSERVPGLQLQIKDQKNIIAYMRDLIKVLENDLG